MNPSALRRLLLAFGVTNVAIGVACSGSDPDPASSSSGSPSAEAGADTAAPGLPPSEAGADGSTAHPVTFTYRPSWRGVKSIEVIGAFGQGAGTDWKMPFLTLADDGTGTFVGKTSLASGHYLYLFRVTGDADGPDGAKGDKLARYAIDPALSAFAVCPEESPTAKGEAANPCSDLTVPQPAAAPRFHASGVVQSGGAPIAGYLVEIERQEPKSHHMFADRMTTGANGKFDLAVAAGTYRFQVLHPTFYALTDAQRASPETLGAVRRSISSGVTLSADMAINPAEVGYGSYASMTPRGATALPTTFAFTVPAGAKARAAVYGPGAEIGDPWWTAPFGTATSDVFDGGFNTTKAPDGGLKADASYAWGTEQQYAAPAGGVTWTAQSMVLPVQFP